MLAALLPHPGPTADLVAVERRIEASIPFLEDVQQVWPLDDNRVVAFVTGVRQARYAGDPPEKGGLGGLVYTYGDYSYLGIWNLAPSEPKRLAQGPKIESYLNPQIKPTFTREKDNALFVGAYAGADHHRIYVQRIDLRRNRITEAFDSEGKLRSVKHKSGRLVIEADHFTIRPYTVETLQVTFKPW